MTFLARHPVTCCPDTGGHSRFPGKRLCTRFKARRSLQLSIHRCLQLECSALPHPKQVILAQGRVNEESGGHKTQVGRRGPWCEGRRVQNRASRRMFDDAQSNTKHMFMATYQYPRSQAAPCPWRPPRARSVYVARAGTRSRSTTFSPNYLHEPGASKTSADLSKSAGSTLRSDHNFVTRLRSATRS